MHDEKIQKLIHVAQNKMRTSNDPIHDIDHVTRVVAMVSDMIQEIDISEKETQAIILAAWWHDVGRTITKRPSFIYMLFIDDIISAFMLWMYTLRVGMFGRIVGLATRIILCKSYGSGKLFTKLFISKKHRILVDIVEDADMIDILHVTRLQRNFSIVESSYKYKFGYRVLALVLFSKKTLDMRTEIAKKHLRNKLAPMINWIEEKEIYNWHKKTYGKNWADSFKKKIQNTIQRHNAHKIKNKIV